jgi:hypothetical protein
MNAFESGFMVGILVGEGHFGGDGKQPHVSLRMHTRHQGLFMWLEASFPGGRLYGPYHHGGRSYYQWMVRGRALRDELLPLLESSAYLLDDHVRGRVETMCSTYSLPWFPRDRNGSDLDVPRDT